MAKKKKPTKKPAGREVSAFRLVAETIARDIMTTGHGEIVSRMVMEGRHGEDLGGRNLASVAGVIEGHLRAFIYIYEAGVERRRRMR